MAKIAAELERAVARRAADGAPGKPAARLLADGAGWSVSDVLCTSGPRDHPFEERHPCINIAVVVAGTFQYRASLRAPGSRPELMTPGSLMLGNAGQCFECSHEHAAGDRCLSFHYAPEYFERLAAGAGARSKRGGFTLLRLPPLRSLSPVVAAASAGLMGRGDVSWEELGVRLAGEAMRLANGLAPRPGGPMPSTLARVTRVVRRIEHDFAGEMSLRSLAREAGLSPFHFLRVFEELTGATPHQYIRRQRLRLAAARLAAEPARILDVAFDSGFGDVSNFNHAFRAEFGRSPRAFRRHASAIA